MAGAVCKLVIKRSAQIPTLLLLLLALASSGCDPVSLTVLGVGSSTGVQHTLSGISYRTFTAPLNKTHAAVTTALGRMGIKVVSTEKNEKGLVVKASTPDREIEIQLESISPNTTRMRSIARNGVFMDASTATEIIIQTEKVMGVN